MIKFRTCPKCGYSPQPGDKGVLYACLNCGLDYSKYDDRRSNIKIMAILLVSLIIISIFVAAQHGGLNEVVGAIKSNYINFSQAAGTITSSKKVRVPKSEDYEHNIYYGFMVHEKLYVSNTVTFQSKRKNVDELVSKYPSGEKVVVYYDENNPEFSVLEPKVVGYEQLYWGLSVLILIPILFWFTLSSNFNSANKYIASTNSDAITVVNFRIRGWVALVTYGIFGYLVYSTLTSDEPRIILNIAIAIIVAALTVRVKTKFDRTNNTITFTQSVVGIAMRKSFDLRTSKLASTLVKLIQPAGGSFQVLHIITNDGRRFQIAAFIGGSGDVELANKLEDLTGIKYEGYL